MAEAVSFCEEQLVGGSYFLSRMLNEDKSDFKQKKNSMNRYNPWLTCLILNFDC